MLSVFALLVGVSAMDERNMRSLMEDGKDGSDDSDSEDTPAPTPDQAVEGDAGVAAWGDNVNGNASSFLQESPNSFADIDAKLKQLEEKTKAELAKLNSETAAPSSFIQTSPSNSFADIDAKLKQLEEKTKSELAKLNSETAAPSSFIEMEEGEGEGEDESASLLQYEKHTRNVMDRVHHSTHTKDIDDTDAHTAERGDNVVPHVDMHVRPHPKGERKKEEPREISAPDNSDEPAPHHEHHHPHKRHFETKDERHLRED